MPGIGDRPEIRLTPMFQRFFRSGSGFTSAFIIRSARRSRTQAGHSSFCAVALVLAFWLSNSGVLADPGPLTLWYSTPGVPGNATSWQHEALPVGHGKLAAMVYGGVGSEQMEKVFHVGHFVLANMYV